MRAAVPCEKIPLCKLLIFPKLLVCVTSFPSESTVYGAVTVFAY